MTTNVLWAPWPGPQTDFCRATEFELLFGGAKGPGKSDCILMMATAQTDKPAYKALILRESFGELQELIDRSHRLFPRLAGRPKWNGNEHRWVWPSGASITFGYYTGPNDIGTYQGKEWAYIGYDEIGKLREEKGWTLLMTECRCPDPTVRRMMRASANPGGPGHHWLKKRFIQTCGKDGERVHETVNMIPSGQVVRLTRRYIPARVTDNPVYANDPQYMAQLMSQPEIIRRQLLHGDWDAGSGAALSELDETKHIVPPFTPPSYWYHFAGFDWGYAHNWVYVWCAATEDGRVFVIDTVKGRRHLPHEIGERISSRVPVHMIHYTMSDRAPINERRAWGDATPTIAERLAEHEVYLQPCSTDRKMGLNNLRHYLAWRGERPELDRTPMLQFLDTEGNRWLFEQLQSMVTDPDDMEDTLKVNADETTGEGGDDGYDAIRVALASRPMAAPSTFLLKTVRAFDPTVLAYEYEQGRRDRRPVARSATRMPSGYFSD